MYQYLEEWKRDVKCSISADVKDQHEAVQEALKLGSGEAVALV